jgi:hypothetical protein
MQQTFEKTISYWYAYSFTYQFQKLNFLQNTALAVKFNKNNSETLGLDSRCDQVRRVNRFKKYK